MSQYKQLAPPPLCPLCSNASTRIYWKSVWNSTNQSVFSCDNCGLLFLHPMMSQIEESEYYDNYVNHLETRIGVGKESPSQTFERRKSLTDYRVEAIASQIPVNANVLEIGGGCGNVLFEIKRRGLAGNVLLVEPCPEHRDFAQKTMGLKSDSDISNLKEKTLFDFICCFHVFEHIRDPLSFLDNCFKLLDENGVFCLEVPSSNDPLLSLYNCDEFKNFYFQPMHHYIYSEHPLQWLADSKNLVAEFIYVQRYGLPNHLHWLSKGAPPSHADNPFDSLTADIDSKYKRNLEKIGKTDTIFCFLSRKQNLAKEA